MYFITCFDADWLQNCRWFSGLEEAPRDKNGGVAYRPESRRTFGYFRSEEDALQAVRENWGDLHEHRYALCCVEHVEEGIHAGTFSTLEPKWFAWREQELAGGGAWVETSRPPETSHLVGFSLG